jgi:hypothetical protein
MAERKTPTTKPRTAAKPKAAAKPTAKPAAKAAAKPKPKPKAAAKPKAKTPRKAADRRSKRTSAARSDAEAARDVALFDNFGAIRDLLAEHVVLTAERLREPLDDAVRRGRMLPLDAEELTQRLVTAGRRHADELRAELETRIKR